MNAALTSEAVIGALAVMAEARSRLARDVAPGDYALAQRITIAEGTLRGELMAALPKDVPLRSAA